MKYRIIYISAVLIILVLFDVLFGAFMRKVEPYSYNKNSVCYSQFDSDVLILGASSSVYDISPNVIEEEFGMSSYCGGEGANGCLVAWARYNMCIRHHIPKMIIYCVTPGYDCLEDVDGTIQNSLHVLQDYYDRDSVVTEIFKDIKNPMERIKYKSNFVKYNPEWIRTLVHAATGSKKNAKGHGFYYGTFTPFEEEPAKHHGPYVVDSVKLKYLTDFFSDIKSRNIQIFCVLAPQYYDRYDAEEYEHIFELCRNLDIPVINNDFYPEISGKPDFFFDSVHLNETGAQAYTVLLCQEIKELLKKESTVNVIQ